ncbi:glycosyl transferases group 1 family protein [Desulfovibrio sp. A2]|nr:glycosyl transferases group 1 family protein [Desulfovibrio sp. A2]
MQTAPLWFITYRFPADARLAPSLVPEIEAILDAGLNLTLLPYEAHGEASVTLPVGIAYDTSLNDAPEKCIPLRVLKGLCSQWTWREFLNSDCAKAILAPHQVLNRSARIAHYAPILRMLVRREITRGAQLPVLYTDRFDALTYAACTLKLEFPQLKVVTRAIGYDIYRERYRRGYLPLRLQFATQPDIICPVSEVGSQYLIREYNIPADKVRTYHRGVDVASTCAKAGTVGTLKLVSCSYCTPVKRLDLLIRRLHTYAAARQEIAIHWIHIGDGELLASLQELARSQLTSLSNVLWEMPGYMTPDGIRQHYATCPVDAYVMVSASEGLPKTIMEAQAHGIPTVATSVGGIPELVDQDTGILLSQYFTQQEFDKALDAIVTFRTADRRERIRQYCISRFDRRANTDALVKGVFLPLCQS